MIALGSAMTYFIGDVVSWRILALIGELSCLVYSINPFALYIVVLCTGPLFIYTCRNYSVSGKSAGTLLYSRVSKMAGKKDSIPISFFNERGSC